MAVKGPFACGLAVVLLTWLIPGCGEAPTPPVPPDPPPLAGPLRLAFRTPPASPYQQEPIAPSLEVEVRDSSGALTGATTTIRLSLIGGVAGATLTGTVSAAAESGVARFEPFVISRSGTGFRLVATAPGLVSDTTEPFAVLRRPATALRFVAEPANGAAGALIGPLAVELLDARSVRATGDSTTAVVVRLAGGGADRLRGDTMRIVTGGLARFDSLRMDSAGSGFRLIAAVAGLGADTSAAFDLGARVQFRPGTLALGTTHSCGVGADGAAYCWGDNFVGQLGDGVPLTELTPVAVRNAPLMRSVAVSQIRACGLATSGVTYCWGWIGWGATPLSAHPVPEPLPGMPALTRLTMGDSHGCGLAADGAAWCWGYNRYGQLGNGTAADNWIPTPVAVAGGHAFVEIGVGSNHSCGLLASGTALCWGKGAIGGPTDDAESHVPAAVASSIRFRGLAIGAYHSCGLDSAGSAFCWGGGGSEALGLGRNSEGRENSSSVPAPVVGGHTFTQLRAGGNGTCGITENGETLCWGRPVSQPGVDASRPSRVAGPAFTDVAITAGTYRTTTCGVTAAGEAWCWGDNDEGQLGDGTRTDRATPVRVSGGAQFVSLALGTWSSCGITADGGTRCWGSDLYGALGRGRRPNSNLARRVAGAAQLSSLVAGYSHNCGLDAARQTWCWGGGSYAQLGDGERLPRSTPFRRDGGSRKVVAAGGGHGTCDLDDAGAVTCWGWVAPWWGNPMPPQETWISGAPVAVPSPVAFDTIAIGFAHRCALTAGGEAWCWTFNGTGQLGEGTTTNRFEPVRVAGGHTFATISAGGGHTCALTAAGAAWCWGNRFGTTPGRIGEGLTFGAISTARDHTCALTPAGEAWCWGDNTAGQLGTASPGANVPVRVAGDHMFTAIAAGANHSCGVTREGDVWCWGDNQHGQLGNGTYQASPVPVLVIGLPGAPSAASTAQRASPPRPK